MNHKIFNIFPTAISVCEDIDPKFSQEEKLTINNCLNDTFKNTGNKTSHETYLLEKLPYLKSILLDKIKHHYYEVLKHDNESEIYITQSWINLAKKGDYHHTHNHPNSILSGVFYLRTVDNDAIILDNSFRAPQIRPSLKEFNEFNSTIYTQNVKDNMLIIFPSNLYHSVPTVKKDQIRISLAFNTFVKGKIGDSKNLAELYI